VTVLLAGQTVEGIREGIAAHHAIAALNRLAPGLLVPVIVGQSATRVAEHLTAPAVVLPFQTTTAAMAGCYQAVDLCLVTSEVETFGRIGAEAQACGTPVIAFAAGGIPEVVRDGLGGWVVPIGDVAGLVTAMERLATDPGRRARLAQGGRAYVESHFDQMTVAAQHVALYREILARGRT
jgi:glycosyltransferase involved in cell wall biosynthesis